MASGSSRSRGRRRAVAPSAWPRWATCSSSDAVPDPGPRGLPGPDVCSSGDCSRVAARGVTRWANGVGARRRVAARRLRGRVAVVADEGILARVAGELEAHDSLLGARGGTGRTSTAAVRRGFGVPRRSCGRVWSLGVNSSTKVTTPRHRAGPRGPEPSSSPAAVDVRRRHHGRRELSDAVRPLGVDVVDRRQRLVRRAGRGRAIASPPPASRSRTATTPQTSWPASRTASIACTRRAAGGDDVLDDQAALARLERRALDAALQPVRLGLLADEERLHVGAAGERGAGGARRRPSSGRRRRSRPARAA